MKYFHKISRLAGIITRTFTFNPMNLYQKNNLSFFQGNVIKYVCRYLGKNGIEDLEKIKHYCDLEILKLKNAKKKK